MEQEQEKHMICKCGNRSRWEIYRMEVVRYVMNRRVGEFKFDVENKRPAYVAQIITVLCIKCGKEGPVEDFNGVDVDILPKEGVDPEDLPKSLVKYMTLL